MVATLFLLSSAQIAHAQFQGYSSPQGVVQKGILNAATAPTTVAVSQNLGQVFHLLTYTTSGSVTAVDLRIEGSYDNSTWFAISDDATDLNSAECVAIGYYPFVRVNLVAFAGTGNITANYSGTSSTSGSPWGVYNPSQQFRKILFTNSSNGSSTSITGVVTPYGSTAGFLVVQSPGGFPNGSLFTVTIHFGQFNTLLGTFTLPTTAGAFLAFPIGSTPSTTVDVSYSSGGASANTFSAYYIFLPPGAALPSVAQPGILSNRELTGTNSSLTWSVNGSNALQRGHLFSVSARCSAGTAGLTVTDGGTTIWTSGATEVGTTTFRFQWNPGLAGSAGNTLVVQLSTCGAANVGTLDVQGSAF